MVDMSAGTSSTRPVQCQRLRPSTSQGGSRSQSRQTRRHQFPQVRGSKVSNDADTNGNELKVQYRRQVAHISDFHLGNAASVKAYHEVTWLIRNASKIRTKIRTMLWDPRQTVRTVSVANLPRSIVFRQIRLRCQQHGSVLSSVGQRSAHYLCITVNI